MNRLLATLSKLKPGTPKLDGNANGENPNDLYMHFAPLELGDLHPLYKEPAHNLKPLAVGLPSTKPGDSNGKLVASLLEEFGAFLEMYTGKSLKDLHLTPKELCTLRKTPGQQCAIPHRALWPNIGYIIVHRWVPIRMKVGFPLWIMNGYRPADYNKAVGGAENSLHINGAALDLLPFGKYNTTENRFKVVYASCELHIEDAEEKNSGLGVYGTKDSPSDVHVDSGFRKHPYVWKNAAYHLATVRRQAGMLSK